MNAPAFRHLFLCRLLSPPLSRIGWGGLLAVIALCLCWPVATRAQNPGSLDAGFNVGAGANADVYPVVVQPNGKILLGGYFTAIGGETRNRIARLNADGSLDTDFDPGAGVSGYTVLALVQQADGKVFIGGDFDAVGGAARNDIARLNVNGGLDTSFDPGVGTDGFINSLAVQGDGKVLLSGGFSNVGGIARHNIARLNTNGSLDTGFDPGAGADNYVFAVAVQTSGKVIVGGRFTSVNGQTRNGIARLNVDGSLDTSFVSGAGANNDVAALAVQADGKILLGGAFTEINGVSRNRIARLNADGSLDTSFDPGAGVDGAIYALAMQADGKIILGGSFIGVGGQARNSIARLNADGSLDTGFNPGAGANDKINGAVLQSDGKVVVGGNFTSIDGKSQNHIARLNSDPRGTLQFDAASYNAAESLGSVTLLVTRKGGSAGAVSVNYSTANGSAQAGSDYTATSGTLSWADGDSSAKSFTVPITNDTVVEGSESFAVALSAPTAGASLGSPVQSIVTILDDDTVGGSPGVVQFGEPVYNAAENAGAATITVKRLGGTAGAVSVGYASADSTATAGADYQPVAGTLSWADGDGSPKTFTVPIIDDAVYEGNETLNLALSNATGGAAIGSPAQTTLTILDNELAPPPPAGAIAFSQTSYNIVENAGSVAITATRTGGAVGAVSVNYATTAGSAAAGTRYQDASGTLTWADGDAAPKSFVVPILNDTVADGSQTVLLSLTAPTGGASLGGAAQAVLTIQDDGDTAPPPPSADLIQAVNLLSPPTDITVLAGDTIDLYVSVEASAGSLRSVEFFAGDLSLGGSTAMRDRKTWKPATPGDYVLKAVATDINGAQKSSFEPIHVQLPQNNATAPDAALLSDLEGKQFAAGSTVQLVASATDASGAPLQNVQFYADGALVPTARIDASAASSGGRTRREGSSGEYYGAALLIGNLIKDTLLTAASTNSQGITTVSQGVTIKAAAASDTLSCAITSPADGGQIAAGTTTTVSAGKAGGAIRRVEFFVNRTSIGALESEPFTFTMPAQPAGRYALTAIATDDAGVSKVSAPVIVTFADLPTVSLAAAPTPATAGGKAAALTLRRTGGDLSQPVTVSYKIKGGAKAGVDYKMLSGQKTIPAGQDHVKLKVKALGDLGGAAQKTLKLLLLPGDGYLVDPAAKPVKVKLLHSP